MIVAAFFFGFMIGATAMAIVINHIDRQIMRAL